MQPIYPLTIIRDRHLGLYSKGVYLAFKLRHYQIPRAVSMEPVVASKFWKHRDIMVGRGETIDEAVQDLYNQLYPKPEK